VRLADVKARFVGSPAFNELTMIYTVVLTSDSENLNFFQCAQRWLGYKKLMILKPTRS
jgi:hypothetical protein